VEDFGMIELVNLRDFRADKLEGRLALVRAKHPGRQVVYVGRGRVDGKVSPLRNTHDENEGSREKIIEMFREDLWKSIKNKDKAVLDALNEIGSDAILCCWCVPLPCHSMVIKRAVEWLRNKPTQ
jgi:hypothetical protein